MRDPLLENEAVSLQFSGILGAFSSNGAVRAAMVGAGWLASGDGRDAAHGSGPLGTIVQDGLSLLIYYLLVSLLIV